MKLHGKLQWKKCDYQCKMDMDAKKQKKQFQNMKICDIFSKLATLFWNPIFFCKWKKKSIFETKKTKIMQQFQLKFFKNTLVRSIFYISNETLHFFNISFTETPWNYTKNQSFTETGRKKMGLFGIKLAKRTDSNSKETFWLLIKKSLRKSLF